MKQLFFKHKKYQNQFLVNLSKTINNETPDAEVLSLTQNSTFIAIKIEQLS